MAASREVAVDKVEKIQTQLSNLSKAQLALLAQQPPDIDGYEQLADVVSGLQYKLLTLSSAPAIAALDPAEEQSLETAVNHLAQAIRASQGATEILNAATALAQS